MSERPLIPTLTIAGIDADTWRVRSIDANERLFAPTRVTVLAHRLEPVELDDVIGLDASLALAIDDGPEGAFHGVIVECAELAQRDDAFLVELVIASKLSILTLGRDHRIYQEMTVQDVVSDVLSRAGLSDSCTWSLNGSYEPHANIVQYGESDYDFITRLLHEEGIGYLVEQREDAEAIVFFDDDTAFTVIAGESLLRPVWLGAMQAHYGVLAIHETHKVGSDQVAMRDYNLEQPGTDLTVAAVGEASTAHEVYTHPVGYMDTGRGQRLADRLLERLQMRGRVVRGQSNVLTLTPGRFFTAADMHRPALDGDYVLLEVHHRVRLLDQSGVDGLTFGYENDFEAIPVDVPYRPEHATPAPVIAGVQHAFVTVPGGEEIHSDEFGRAKVRFPWDRSGRTDDTSSTWLRVGQVALGGSMIIPRVDFEVLVDFELGDVDRPLISGLGHLYNVDKAPPYALPGGMTVSSLQTATTGGGAGANELRFEDSAGGEEIFINASKDMTASVDNDTSWNVNVNQTRDIGSNETMSVTADHFASVTGNRTLTVGGNQDVNVGGEYGDGTGVNLTYTVGANRFVKSGGDHSENVKGTLTRTVGTLQSITGIAGVSRTVAGASKTNVKAAWAEMCGGARALNITGAYTETIGALKFIKAKTASVSCDSAYSVTGALYIVKAGGSVTDGAKAAVTLTATAAFDVKAKNIVIEAKNKLVFRAGGASIELTKAGAVKIKAPTVTVENAEALNQIMHKSN